MKDLTQGSITRHIGNMALPVAAGMVVQTLYQMVDLYFVSGLGHVAVAGVGAAGSASFIVVALSQVLGVGTTSLISQATGRRDQADASLIFNQSLILSGMCAVGVLACGYVGAHAYLHSVAADAATVEAGVTYLLWLMPGMSLQFFMTSMASALRGTGIVKPTMLIQMVTVVINAVLAPMLIAGWGTGHPLGIAGAGLATTLSIALGVAILWVYFHRLERFLVMDRARFSPRWKQWGRIFQVGLPAGAEFALSFVVTGISYYAIRHFGSAAQAGYGIGARVLHAIVLPAMAVAFATGPITGQNYGARKRARVIETFRQGAILGSAVMMAMTLVAQWRPEALIGLFTEEPETLSVGVLYLRVISWNLVAQGIIYTCSCMFQGLGNTRPSLLSSLTRLVTYAAPAIWLSNQPTLRIDNLWHLSVATVAIQAAVSLWLLQRELRTRLAPIGGTVVPEQTA